MVKIRIHTKDASDMDRAAEEVESEEINKTEHSSYFGKQPFGKKTKFQKMEHTTIPLVTDVATTTSRTFLPTTYQKPKQWLEW